MRTVAVARLDSVLTLAPLTVDRLRTLLQSDSVFEDREACVTKMSADDGMLKQAGLLVRSACSAAAAWVRVRRP